MDHVVVFAGGLSVCLFFGAQPTVCATPVVVVGDAAAAAQRQPPPAVAGSGAAHCTSVPVVCKNSPACPI